MTGESLVVQMRGITKRFPGVLANDRVDLDVRAGEIHALLGENGAGKSTLMNVLAGLYHPDAGEIVIRGQRREFRSPRDAIAQGIGMVHQHFMLVNAQTVAENIILGRDRPHLVLNMGQIERELTALAEQYRMPVHPQARIWQLSVGEQQRVEILKMLYRGTEVLILDEPTAVLTPQEAEQLFLTIFSLSLQGKSIIFITHKLKEVFNIATRITVLRDGRVVGTISPKDTDERQLATMMVGREVLFQIEKQPVEPGEVILEVQDLQARNDRGLPALRGVSFTIRRGEILGVAGVAGNGQRELAEVLTGLRKATGGCVKINGQETTRCSSREVINRKVSHVPEDRLGEGLIPNLTVADNEILKEYRSPALSRGPFLVPSAIVNLAKKLIAAFDIDTPGPGTVVRLLSGGNQQKVLLARELHLSPNLLVAVHPTRGLDVGATEFVRQRLLQQRTEGTGILLISEDLDEVLALSDRVAVLYEGQTMGILPAAEAEIATIGLMMAGKRKDEGRRMKAES
jgi:simple sugar transport system ATP-binding protein